MESPSLELSNISSNKRLPEMLKARVTVPAGCEGHYMTTPGPFQAPGVAGAVEASL